jgi:hypothetical protein
MDSEGLLEEAAVSRWEVVGESRTLEVKISDHHCRTEGVLGSSFGGVSTCLVLGRE